MKIIRPGNLPSQKVFTATCSNCKCHFEFKAGEAKFESCQRDGSWYSIRCPQPGCGHTVNVNASQH